MTTPGTPGAARVVTAGVILLYGDRFVFQVGRNRAGDALGVVRLGGHLEAEEEPAACARREVLEEACVDAQMCEPPSTFAYDAAAGPAALRPVQWTGSRPAPLFVGRAHEDDEEVLSVTYRATTDVRPVPGAETQALLLLTAAHVRALADTTVTLPDIVAAGAEVIAAVDLPADLPLRPHAQLVALSELLRRGEDCSL